MSEYSGFEEVHLFLYDTAGQERFADMAASYYRVGEVCLLCFDMSDLSTFDRTQFWKKKVSAALPSLFHVLDLRIIIPSASSSWLAPRKISSPRTRTSFMACS